MKILKNTPVLISLLLFIMAGCTEKINLTLDGTYTRLVVDAMITSDTTVQRVKLTTTTDYFSNQPAPPVRDAIITISDGTSSVILHESLLSPGVYETANNFFGVAGKTYKLSINLASAINGKTNYEAVSEMRPVTRIDSIRLESFPNWHAVAVRIYAQDPPSIDFYMFNTYKNHKLITDTINKVAITDDKLFNGNYTNGIAVGFLRQEDPAEKVNPGDTISLQICGIALDYYNFIADVQRGAGFNNPLFGGPPANVRGNINNGAIGFFAAYSVNYASTIAK